MRRANDHNSSGRARVVAIGAAVSLLCIGVFGVVWWQLGGDATTRQAAGDDPAVADDDRSEPLPRRVVHDADRGSDVQAGTDAGPAADGAGEAGAFGDPDAEARARRAEELANDPNTQVVCDLGIDVPTGMAYLAIGGHSDFNGRRAEVVNGKAYLPLVYDLGDLGDATIDQRSGTFSLEGYGPQTLTWSDPPEDGGNGHCTAVDPPEPGHASLTGTLLLDPSGAPAAGGWVEGCGNLSFADGNGIVHMDIVTEPCTVIAMRQDGMLRTTSQPVAVTPQPGQDVVVDFVIPEAPRGGLGVQIVQTDDGIVIDGLVEGGPAGEAGLQPGDLVVEVDGDPALDLELMELVEAVGGEAGTEVGLVVDRNGQRIEVTIVREQLTPG